MGYSWLYGLMGVRMMIHQNSHRRTGFSKAPESFPAAPESQLWLLRFLKRRFWGKTAEAIRARTAKEIENGFRDYQVSAA